MTTTHPEIVVRLTGRDSNVFGLLGRCTQALKQHGHHDDAKLLTEQVIASASFDEALRHMASMVAVS